MGNQRALGTVHSPEYRAAASERMRGNTLSRGVNVGRVRSAETREKVAAAKRGKKRAPFSAEWRERMSQGQRANQNAFGTVHSLEYRMLVSARVKGTGNPNYRDGKSVERRNERLTLLTKPAYRAFRKAVLERDGFTCVECGGTPKVLHVDHVKPWRLYPELRFDPANGRVLCPPCHWKTPTFGMRALLLTRAG